MNKPLDKLANAGDGNKPLDKLANSSAVANSGDENKPLDNSLLAAIVIRNYFFPFSTFCWSPSPATITGAVA